MEKMDCGVCGFAWCEKVEKNRYGGGCKGQDFGGWRILEESSFPRVDDDGDGAVVDEGDMHHGAELAVRDGFAEGGGELGEELFVEGFGEVGLGGVVEGGARAFAATGDERELADDERATAGVAQGAVHRAGVVGKDAQRRAFFDEP